VSIQPIISIDINQSGPLISTGKMVSGDIQVRKNIPEKNAGIFILSLHQRI
jgi:hypothetical protein